jgi:hypothetical protein
MEIKEIKEIYSFNIYETKDVSVETESTDENGNAITITKKVSEQVPVKVTLKKPSRRQIEEADLEYSVEMSRCVKKGILTKAMLVKKYSDTGGLMSETEAKSLYQYYQKLGELHREYSENQVLTKDEKRDKELTLEMAEIRDKIVKIEMAYQNLFEHTADMKAQNRLLLWYILNLTMIQGESDKAPKYYFKGDNFEERLEDYYEKEESDDAQYFLIAKKVSTIAAYWFYNQASNKEEFDKLFDEPAAPETKEASDKELEKKKEKKKKTESKS